MAKIEIPGLDQADPPKLQRAVQQRPGVQSKEAPSLGEPLEGDLDPVLAQAVASQPVIPRPMKAEPEPPPMDAEEPPASGSPSFPAPRRRALGGFLAAGALALAGIAATAVLGGKRNGSATGVHASPRPEATGASGGVLGAAALDGSETELARLFGLDPGG